MDALSESTLMEFILYNNWANQQVLQARPCLAEMTAYATRVGKALVNMAQCILPTDQVVEEAEGKPVKMPSNSKAIAVLSVLGPPPQQASLRAGQVVYVGDNYFADVVGARNAGMKPVLLDIADLFEQPGCPVVHSHMQLLDLSEQGKSGPDRRAGFARFSRLPFAPGSGWLPPAEGLHRQRI